MTTLFVLSFTVNQLSPPPLGPRRGLFSRWRFSIKVPLRWQHQQKRVPRALHQHQVPGHTAHQWVGANPDLNLELRRHKTVFGWAGHTLSADSRPRPQKPEHAHSCWNFPPNLPVAACNVDGGLLVCVSDLSFWPLGRLSLYINWPIASAQDVGCIYCAIHSILYLYFLLPVLN